MNVTKETILEYLFDRLDIERRSEVEEALRVNDDLHAFFCERLSHIRELQPEAFFADQAESVGDKGLDGDGADSLVYDNDDLELRTGNVEFDRYVGLPPEEAARRYMIEILEKRAAAAVSLASCKIYHARSESIALSANHVAANVRGPRDQNEPYTFTWKPLQDEHAIMLTFVDHSKELGDRERLVLDVEFRYQEEGAREWRLITPGRVELTKIENQPTTWAITISLEKIGLTSMGSSIKKMKGTYVG